MGENKVYSNETHDGQNCETEVVGAVEDDCDEEVEVARLPALRHPCGLGRGRRRTAAAAQLAGYRAEDGAETDNFNFSAARLKTDTHTHKLPRTFMFGNSISIYLDIMYTLSRSLSISNRSCMRRYIDVDI